MIDHDVMIAAKVSMLESLVRDLVVDRFMQTSSPLVEVKRYAQKRSELAPGKSVEADLEPIREGVWQAFFDGVISDVQKRMG